MSRLVAPSLKYKKSFIAALKEFEKEAKIEADPNDVEGYIAKTKDYAAGNVPAHKVQETTLWLVDNDSFIGRVGIRHTLNDKLKQRGGHIGYIIRPSKRKQGYGSQALQLALRRAKKIGLTRVLITCDDDNIASQKIIEKHGGVYHQTVIWKGKNKRHYWIDIN